MKAHPARMTFSEAAQRRPFSTRTESQVESTQDPVDLLDRSSPELDRVGPGEEPSPPAPVPDAQSETWRAPTHLSWTEPPEATVPAERTLAQAVQEAVTRQVIRDAAAFHRQQAYEVMDRFLAARDPVTELLPLHVRTEQGRLIPTDHMASGLDLGRQTAGLVMTARVAAAAGDTERARRYLEAAESNYAAGKLRLAQGDRFVQRRDFHEDGSVRSTEVGEPGKSAPGEDNMTRVNPRAYAFRGAAELYGATGKAEYRADLERFFRAWVEDFHDPSQGGFFIHANVEQPGDHKEIGSFKEPGGVDSQYDGRLGAKGNDGVVYAMSSVLLIANELLGTPQTQGLVREQMDIILEKLHRQNGMLWENYAADFRPLSQDWQNQPRVSPDGQPAVGAGVTSHVAIGGHTAMAGQQVLEGARQLRRQGALSEAEYQSYVDRTVELFQDFAVRSGAVDWNTGAVHNAMRVEEPEQQNRWIREWGDAAWQQAELLQTLVRLKEEDRLKDIQGPDGRNGNHLLALAQQYYERNYPLPEDYAFQDYFGNPDVYHRPQVALYFQQAS